MKVGLIGTGTQAEKIFKLIKKDQRCKNILIFHPKKKKNDIKKIFFNSLKNKNISYSNNIKDLFDCTGVFIASTSETHVKYIKILVKKDLLLFCEKPPATNYKDLIYLKKLPKKLKKKIIFNFHLPYSPLYEKISKIINNKKNGKFIKINFSFGNGLAFKKGYKNNWRFLNNNIFSNIVGNIGIHYIHLFEKLFGDIKIKKINRANYSKAKNFDTAEILFNNDKNIFSKIFLSYAIPFTHQLEIFFTNSIVIYSDDMLNICSPRNYLDRFGNFKRASKKKILKISYKKNSHTGLKNILNIFLSKSSTKKFFDVKEFDRDIKINQKLLDYYK